MPILIENFHWKQTDDKVIITLPLNGVSSKCINDIFITENFVKVNYSPYYFEAFLEHPIIKAQSKCKILEMNIKLILQKATNEVWNELSAVNMKEKSSADKVGIKKAIIDANQVAVNEEFENKKKVKAEIKKHNIENEIKREQEIKRKIDDVCKNIKSMEANEVFLYYFHFNSYFLSITKR